MFTDGLAILGAAGGAKATIFGIKFLVGGLLLAGWALEQWFFTRRGATKLPLSGLEFLILGGVAAQVLPAESLERLTADVLDPFMTVALGLVGFYFGIHLSVGEVISNGLRNLGKIFTTCAVISGIIWFLLSRPAAKTLLHWPEEGQATLALLFASLAPICSAVYLRAGIGGKLVPRKIRSRVLLYGGITPLISMLFLFFSVLGTTAHGLGPANPNWILITCLVVLILVLFLLAASLVPDRDGRQFSVHLGLICLVAGTATVLGFPALVFSFLVGFFLAHLPGLVKDLDGTISIMDRPLYFVLMLIAGLQLEWANTYLLQGALGVATLLVITKIVVTWLHGLAFREEEGKRLGRYLMSMGPIPIALGLSVYLIMEPGSLRETFLGTLSLMVIAAEVVQLLYCLHQAGENPAQANSNPAPVQEDS